MSEHEFILAIEPAIQGGSISLLHGLAELDGWVGTSEVSGSEDILPAVQNISKRNGLEMNEIKKIIISSGPGSHTGLRIGMAIGFGLKKALGYQLREVSALEAMLLTANRRSDVIGEEIITAVPIGRNQICRQSFRLRDNVIVGKNQPMVETSDLFFKFENFESSDKTPFKRVIVLHRKLFLDLRNLDEGRLRKNNMFIDAGQNIAKLLGELEAKREARDGESSLVGK